METEATSGLEDTVRPMHQPLAIGSAATAATGIPASFGDAETMRPTNNSASHASSADYPALVSIDPQHYVTGEQLARGGMGRIRVAHDRRLGRDVAIKELLVTTPELRARFEREARITAKLQHPAIVGVLEAGTWPSGEPFYAMELVAGKSLDKAIAECATSTERLALLPNVIAVADALAYAHGRRVIHRDLKPANVLVGEFGETVVIDWGLAKDLTDAEAPDLLVGPYRRGAQPGETEAGSVMGTPQYMPIEQAEGETVDERADVYALGAMLYQVLAGVAPYATGSADMVLTAVLAGPPRSLATRGLELPADLVAIVDKAMTRAATDRYPTAKQLAEDLKKFQTGQLVAAHRYTRLQLALRWLRRHRAASRIISSTPPAASTRARSRSCVRASRTIPRTPRGKTRCS
jgi:eukaryotic-like serine/threonine-protein kinase